MGVWQPYRDKCSSMTKVYPKPQSEGQFLTKSIQHVFVVGPWPFQVPMLGVWLWILYTIAREIAKRSGDQWDRWGTREGQEREQEEDQREVACTAQLVRVDPLMQEIPGSIPSVLCSTKFM